MAREKFQVLTEPMFYILIALQEECCGVDIMEKVSEMTDGEVTLGPGTLYTLLGNFLQADMIRETAVEGRKRSYVITNAGRLAVADEYQRIQKKARDYEKYMKHVQQ